MKNYKIVLPHFEGPFDLLLFFIERDELDIYKIPITKIIVDFINYIKEQQEKNVDLSSEFILFVSTLMRIKAKMLIPRKELDQNGNEIDPRTELVQNLIEYKKFKTIAAQFNEKINERMQFVRRGNIEEEQKEIGEILAEGSEINNVNTYKLLRAFEKILNKNRMFNNKHTVYRYNYSMEKIREDILRDLQLAKKLSFENLFRSIENRIQAVFYILNILELVQEKRVKIWVGSEVNNFIIELSEKNEEELAYNINEIVLLN